MQLVSLWIVAMGAVSCSAAVVPVTRRFSTASSIVPRPLRRTHGRGPSVAVFAYKDNNRKNRSNNGKNNRDRESDKKKSKVNNKKDSLDDEEEPSLVPSLSSYKEPLGHAFDLTASHLRYIERGIPIADGFDAAIYSGMGQLSNGGYLYALDARHDTSTGLDSGFPGYFRFARPAVSLKEAKAKYLQAITASSNHEACMKLTELMAMDGISRVAPMNIEMSEPSRHLFALTLPERVARDWDPNGYRFEPKYFRINTEGDITSKHGYREVVHYDKQFFDSLNSAVRFFKHESDMGFFCGFFHVPAAVRERLHSTMSFAAKRKEVIRIMSYTTDLVTMLYEQLSYYGHLENGVRAQLDEFKLAFSASFESFQSLYQKIEATEKLDYIQIERTIQNYYIRLAEHIRRLNQERISDEIDGNEKVTKFLAALDSLKDDLPELDAIVRERKEFTVPGSKASMSSSL